MLQSTGCSHFEFNAGSNRLHLPVMETPGIAETATALRRMLEAKQKVVFITGAGLSAASGLPLYRSAPDAVWEKNMVEWGTRECFLKDPSAWWEVFCDRGYAGFATKRPNPGHAAIAAIAQRWADAVVVTQNVDGLHSAVPQNQLAEAHGRLGLFKCIRASKKAGRCRYSYAESISSIAIPEVPDPSGAVPRCPACGDPVLPNFLCFDELHVNALSFHIYLHSTLQQWQMLTIMDDRTVFGVAGMNHTRTIVGQQCFNGSRQRQHSCSSGRHSQSD